MSRLLRFLLYFIYLLLTKQDLGFCVRVLSAGFVCGFCVRVLSAGFECGFCVRVSCAILGSAEVGLKSMFHGS